MITKRQITEFTIWLDVAAKDIEYWSSFAPAEKRAEYQVGKAVARLRKRAAIVRQWTKEMDE